MKKIILIYISAFVLFACSKKDHELDDTVFIEDNSYSGLPIYSENGYNTFGCYYEREVFKATSRIVPSKVIVQNNSTTLVFEGIFDGYNSSYGSQENYFLKFKFKNKVYNSYEDLTQFHKQKFLLDDPSIEVYWNNDNKGIPLKIISGELEFRRVQVLHLDKEKAEVIASGEFNFQTEINNRPVSFSYGRFDVGIDQKNFYKY